MASISSDRDDNDIVPSRRKDLQDLLDLPRAASESFFRKQSRPRAPRAERIAPGAAPAAGMAAQIFRRLAEFVPTRVIKWVYEYLRYRFGARHPFLVYLKSDLGEGVYKFEDDGETGIAFAGDSGTAPISQLVAESMVSFPPHYSFISAMSTSSAIHRDRRDFLGINNPNNDFAPCKWPAGSRGSSCQRQP